MSYILNIDTAVITASVCLAKNDRALVEKVNPSQKDHAAWLHNAIKEVIEEAALSLQELDAIAVSSGPGSYTGLRVGMAAAKGLCYALQKPLITIGTLKMMAVAAQGEGPELLCPMIDARRMEVFTAVYDKNLSEILSPINVIIEKNSFEEILRHNSVSFFGNGSDKFRAVSSSKNAHFKKIEASAKHMMPLSFSEFRQNRFADLAYAEPFYGKDFYSPFVKPS
ncbi:MAG TPA: tRNA (adenosine(37)-N6)-threonylcarbamoyltransferase complex dimerization subunit type 1 TsaB [Flavisolibacter sp.]|nr:tRNA (adenosine(37)-N6)-threonylcarbamoyltransferase complex dimerization subunit type 1 TsaB [Flavisolibacter sp.]